MLGGATDVSNVATRPAYPFGFGRSYTTFVYQDAGIVQPEISAGDVVQIEITVKNTGDRAGDEIVQVYARDIVASVTRPTRQLVAFTRVSLSAGDSQTVSMRIPASRFAFSDRSMRRIVEPGDVELWVGHDCETPAAALGTISMSGPVHFVSAGDSRSVQVESR